MAEIDDAAEEFGVDAKMMHRFADIESGHNPSAHDPGSSYHGLFQLSVGEFNKYGRVNIYSARDNARAAANKISWESGDLEKKLGRQAEGWEIYMVHQQGSAGFASHMRNPDSPAWENMLSTAEGQQKGEGWAKRAIWGNIPDQDKAKFGRVENVASQDFLDLWHGRFDKGGQIQLAEQHERAGLPDQEAGEEHEAGGLPGQAPAQRLYSTAKTRITVNKPQPSLASVRPSFISDKPSYTAADVQGIPIPQAPDIQIGGRLKVPSYG